MAQLLPVTQSGRAEDGGPSVELTVAVSHEQHRVVDEPRAAEGPQWVRDPMAVELGWGE